MLPESRGARLSPTPPARQIKRGSRESCLLPEKTAATSLEQLRVSASSAILYAARHFGFVGAAHLVLPVVFGFTRGAARRRVQRPRARTNRHARAKAGARASGLNRVALTESAAIVCTCRRRLFAPLEATTTTGRRRRTFSLLSVCAARDAAGGELFYNSEISIAQRVQQREALRDGRGSGLAANRLAVAQ